MPMLPMKVLAAALVAATAGQAQEPARPAPAAPGPAKPTRTLADGLVRERIESQRLEVPKLVGGEELGRGQGPLVMLVRKRDGSLELVELARGEADTGPSPEPQPLDLPPEQEVGVAGQPKAQPPAPRPARPIKVRLRRRTTDDGEQLGVQLEMFPEQTAAKLDAAQLGERFEQLARQRADTDVAGQLLIEAHPDTMVQDVVDLWQIAAQHGFERPLFGGMGNRPLPDETQQLLQSLPKRFDWPSENRGPGGSIKVQGGELLFLLDGPTRWGDFLPLYAHCAQVGIWRLGIVCQQDRAQRSKWSVPLPFDRGL